MMHQQLSQVSTYNNIYQDFAMIKVPCHQSACREFQNIQGWNATATTNAGWLPVDVLS